MEEQKTYDSKTYDSFNDLKIIDKDVDISTEAIEEDRLSNRGGHYTVTVGYYEMLMAEIKVGGRLYLQEKILALHSADRDCVPRFLETWFEEDEIKCIVDEIGTGWVFENRPTYKVIKCETVAPDYYDVEVKFKAKGTRSN